MLWYVRHTTVATMGLNERSSMELAPDQNGSSRKQRWGKNVKEVEKQKNLI